MLGSELVEETKTKHSKRSRVLQRIDMPNSDDQKTPMNLRNLDFSCDLIALIEVGPCRALIYAARQKKFVHR